MNYMYFLQVFKKWTIFLPSAEQNYLCGVLYRFYFNKVFPPPTIRRKTVHIQPNKYSFRGFSGNYCKMKRCPALAAGQGRGTKIPFSEFDVEHPQQNRREPTSRSHPPKIRRVKNWKMGWAVYASSLQQPNILTRFTKTGIKNWNLIWINTAGIGIEDFGGGGAFSKLFKDRISG